MRVAAIDCGTNTIRLLIADPSTGGDGIVAVERAMEYVRLGQGIDATGEFHPEALQRTFAATEAFASRIAAAGIDASAPGAVRFVATSAARDARNRDDFFTGITDRLGVTPEVITGDEEAQLSYLGATHGVGDVADPVLVVDIGGGSTEFVLGEAGQIRVGTSLDIGSVRLTERFLSGDPVEPAGLARAREHVGQLLDTVPIDFAGVRTWIGVAGTLTTISAIAHRLTSYDRAKVHGSTVPRQQVSDLADWFATSTAAQRAEIPTLPPRRADVITAGALIAAAVAERVSVDLRVSETDILDGIALRLAGVA